jgi:hypothetical protein
MEVFSSSKKKVNCMKSFTVILLAFIFRNLVREKTIPSLSGYFSGYFVLKFSDDSGQDSRSGRNMQPCGQKYPGTSFNNNLRYTFFTNKDRKHFKMHIHKVPYCFFRLVGKAVGYEGFGGFIGGNEQGPVLLLLWVVTALKLPCFLSGQIHLPL